MEAGLLPTSIIWATLELSRSMVSELEDSPASTRVMTIFMDIMSSLPMMRVLPDQRIT